jgi:hypothetical protein
LRKVSFILWLLIFISGCAVITKKSVTDNKVPDDLKGYCILKDIEIQNLTRNNFFIQKAEIEIVSGAESQKLIASIKFVLPDKYLISLKSKSGIEAARIYITADTVLINDRINKKLYYGKPEHLKKKFGIDPDVLPIILGDFINGNQKLDNKVYCSNGKADLDCAVGGMMISYTVDCKVKKLISARKEGSLNSSFAEIEYGSFIKKGNSLIPTKINLNNNTYSIAVTIEKIESPWGGSIEFIPGSRYDLIELL